jgi:hypothetical protein
MSTPGKWTYRSQFKDYVFICPYFRTKYVGGAWSESGQWELLDQRT